MTAVVTGEVEGYFGGLAAAERRELVNRSGARLLTTSYLTDVLPPLEHVKSVRCVAFRGDEILALRDPVGAHVLPGGTREPGETLFQTLEREMLEETGWTVTDPRLIGVVHLHWLTERPPHVPEGLPYYPDFLWLIYTAEVAAHRPEALLHEPGEGVPVFLPLADPETAAELERNMWAPENRVYLPAALRLRFAVRMAGRGV